MKNYIWGTGKLADSIAGSDKFEPDAFLDSAEAKWGTSFLGRPVVAPASIDPADSFIMIASIFFYPIYKAVRALGVPEANIAIASETELLTPERSAALIRDHEAHQLWVEGIIQDQMPDAHDFKTDREAHLRHAAAAAPLDGLALEFGVFQGASIGILADSLGQTVYGFDTFEGLPEDWTQFHRKDFFDLKGQTPNLTADVQFVKGLFEDTLGAFLAQAPGPIRFIHCDADLYNSTRYVLAACADRIVPGTVMVFDDFLYELDYNRCDYRAFTEFAADHQLEYRYLSREASGSVALLVTDKKRG